MPKSKLIHPKNNKDSVRPIGARALKSALDTLRPYLFEASVLDLFAGQGRFGITASSEGISSLTFVENNSRTAAELTRFLNSSQFPKTVKTTLLCQDALDFLKSCTDKYDIIFADPPFPVWNKDFENRLFEAVRNVLSQDSIFLVKCPSRMVPSTQLVGLSQFKSSDFGESRLVYYRYEIIQGKSSE